jgi:hypothetical protein
VKKIKSNYSHIESNYKFGHGKGGAHSSRNKEVLKFDSVHPDPDLLATLDKKFARNMNESILKY